MRWWNESERWELMLKIHMVMLADLTERRKVARFAHLFEMLRSSLRNDDCDSSSDLLISFRPLYLDMISDFLPFPLLYLRSIREV